MKDDGARLSITCSANRFAITDNISGASIIYMNGQFMQFNLDKEIVCTHLNNLQQLLTTANKKSFGYKPFIKHTSQEGLTIMERDHYEYRLINAGKCADLNETVLHCQRGFDVYATLRHINQMYSVIIQSNKMLNPTYDIVRRIVDVGVLVWVHDGHSIVCYENNIEGLTMSNCLIDGVYYPVVVVSICKDENRCTLFDVQLNTIIEYPLDDSVLTYYSEVEDSMGD